MTSQISAKLQIFLDISTQEWIFFCFFCAFVPKNKYLCTQNCNFKGFMILDKIDELLKGEITALMNDFRNVATDQKKTVGMKINELKTLATERINQLREACDTQESGDEAIDLTRTPYPIELGTRHPLSIVTNEIIARYAPSPEHCHQRDH